VKNALKIDDVKYERMSNEGEPYEMKGLLYVHQD
jgi:hypothetical protein